MPIFNNLQKLFDQDEARRGAVSCKDHKKNLQEAVEETEGAISQAFKAMIEELSPKIEKHSKQKS